MSHHLIFEGAELSGKSWLMSQVYDRLEMKYSSPHKILDGCHWFNCDIGVYGTGHGRAVIESYLDIFEELRDKNLIVEKLHLSDQVYAEALGGAQEDYARVEDRLLALGFRIVLLTFPPDEALVRARLRDRLRLYPHYARILQDPAWYLRQQERYQALVARSRLPHLSLESAALPDAGLLAAVLRWIGES